MNAAEKNALNDVVKASLNSAIALVTYEVFSGLAHAPGFLGSAAALLRSLGNDQDAVQAEQRAGECAGILLIPWPFIYIGSTAWIGAVARLRDSLPVYVDLEPVNRERRREASVQSQELRASQARARWGKLTEAQRQVLIDAGVKPELLRSLG